MPDDDDSARRGGMGDLREEVRVGTLRRMLRALFETEGTLEALRAEGRVPSDAQVQEAAAYRDSLLASIAEVEARPDEAAVDVDPRHPTHGWGALAKNPWMPIGADGPEYREIIRRIWLRQGGTDEAFESLMPAKPASDETTYPPEAIRVLEGMTPPRRPAGHVEDASDVQES